MAIELLRSMLTNRKKTLNRDAKFDGLKFLLIFLVVLGHLKYYDFDLRVSRIIYSFHMPVFIFLSGFFTSLSSNKEKRISWIKKTLILYIIADIAEIIMNILLEYSACSLKGKDFSISPFINWHTVFYPAFTLWYLLCLVYWRITIWTVGDKINDISLFVISCLLLVIAGFVPLGFDLSYQRTFSFFPFFVLGIVFKKRGLIPKLEKLPVYYAVIGLLLGFIAAGLLPTYFPVQPLKTFDQLAERVIQTLLALFLCIMIIRLSRAKFTETFAKYGSKTLWIYVGHAFLVTISNRLFPYLGISLNIFTAPFVAALYCAFLIFLANTYESWKQKHNHLSPPSKSVQIDLG